jgi:hypothetical protein
LDRRVLALTVTLDGAPLRFLVAHPKSKLLTYQGNRELIDHILATTDLARRPVEITSDTRHVVSISDQPSQRKRGVWPDHAPIIATIS